MTLLPLLAPKSVAIVGASRDPSKIGSQILTNLIKSDYKGTLYPINPKAETIQSIQAYPSLTSVLQTIDLVVIAVPQPLVEQIVNDCITKKVGDVIIITAGFKETGEEGRKLERTLKHKLEKAQIPMIGPNCLGLIIPGQNLNASFAAETPKDGNIMFISQSGAFGTAAIDWATSHNMGFSHFISLGNKAVLNENHFLPLASQTTKAIALYLEEITNGQEFASLAKQVGKHTPILLLKPGKSQKAQQAVKSHTGALTGEDTVLSVAAKQSGILRMQTSQELFDVMKAFSYAPQLAGNNIAIITNAGGPSIIATDAIETSGLKLAEISPKAQSQLQQYLPREANIHDPIDLIGDAKADRYDHALDIILKEKSVDAVLVLLTPQSSTEIERTADSIASHAAKTKKPIIAAFLGGTLIEKATRHLNQKQIPCYHYPEQAIAVFARMWQYQQFRTKIDMLAPPIKQSYLPNPVCHHIIQEAQKQNRTTLTSEEVETLLKDRKIPTPPKHIVTSSADAYKKALTLGTPVVMKISSPSIIHKTEHHAVYMNLVDEEQITEAYNQLNTVLNSAHAHQVNPKTDNRKPTTDYIYIQKQIPTGHELLIGMKRDPTFGPVIVIGSGGIYTEIYKDTASRIAPLTKSLATDMFNETKIAIALRGFRGEPPYNLEPIINTLLALSDISMTYPEIQEIDINPFIVLENSCFAVDARILINSTN